ncbi:hypothetical protein [Gramella jeungdoensis]|nr:hypothetical protein [Gramella jeungdoensis]
MPEFLLKISPVYENGEHSCFSMKIAIKTGDTIHDLEYGIAAKA